MKNTKKLLALCLLAVLLFTVACGGGTASGGAGGNGGLKEDTKMSDIMAAVDAKFAEDYKAQGVTTVVMMPQTLTATEMNELLNLTDTDYTDFAATMAMSMTNSDCLYMIKATKDSVEKVKTALETKRQALIDQYQTYPVSGSYERAVASKVIVKDDCVFYICVGILPDDMDAEPDFAPQVAKAEEVINSFFK